MTIDDGRMTFELLMWVIFRLSKPVVVNEDNRLCSKYTLVMEKTMNFNYLIYTWTKPPDKDFFDNRRGVYLLVGKSQESNITGISHMLARDPLNILYIGKCEENFANRMPLKKYEPKSEYAMKYGRSDQSHYFDHSCFEFCLSASFNPRTLQFSFEIPENYPTKGQIYVGDGYLNKLTPEIVYICFDQGNKEGIKKLEHDLLSAHVIKYGDLPPLNATGASLMSTYHESNKQKLLDDYGKIITDISDHISVIATG